MKKSIQNIALLCMLFVLGACEVKPEDKTPEETPDAAFLSAVEGKSFYLFEETIGAFDTDGKIFSVDSSFTTLGVTGTLTFQSATSETIAIYHDTTTPAKVVTITLDGTTGGSIQVTDQTLVNGTFETVVHPDKVAFLNATADKELYVGTAKLGYFEEATQTLFIDAQGGGDWVATKLDSVASATEATYVGSSLYASILVKLTANGGTVSINSSADTSFTFVSTP